MVRARNSVITGLLIGSFWIAAPLVSVAQDAEPPTAQEETAPESSPEEEVLPTVEAAAALLAIVTAIDEDARLTANGATFTIDDTMVTLVFDVNADRMRLFSQIRPSDGLSGPQLRRLMQANFDTALDARYAVAQGQLWSTFMHRLTSLTQEDFVSALAQTVTLVKTFGTTFSSGAMSFGGGDSNAEIQKLLDRILRDDEEEI
ncbi:MAG: type III secretion system chaperone family protein [Henriciella sp.]